MGEFDHDLVCPRCGETMKNGYLTASGFIGGAVGSADKRLVFVVPGEETSANPLRAFEQGLHNAQTNETYILRGYRCPNCGTVELRAIEKTP